MNSRDERVALMAADKVLERAWGKPKEQRDDETVVMTAVPPALPGRACSKCLKESHEFTCPLLAKADMRVDRR